MLKKYKTVKFTSSHKSVHNETSKQNLIYHTINKILYTNIQVNSWIWKNFMHLKKQIHKWGIKTDLLPETSKTCKSFKLPISSGKRPRRLSRTDKTPSFVHSPICKFISIDKQTILLINQRYYSSWYEEATQLN